MATTTTKLKLIKPAQTDFYNIDDHNANSDKIDAYAVATDAELVTLRATDTSQDTEITGIKTAATALTLRVTNTEAKNTTQDTNIGNLQAETVKLRTDFTAADTTIKDLITTGDSNVTTAFKAGDKAITDAAQMSKITADTGAAYLTILTGENVVSKIDSLPVGVHFVIINPGAVGSPTSTGRPSGLVRKPEENGLYWAVEITDYSTGRSWVGGNYNGAFSGWREVATTDDIGQVETAYKAADKAITDKAQMHKITADNGGTITIGTDTFANFLGANPTLLRSFYTNQTNQTDAPTTMRGLIANTGANTGTGFHWGFGIDYSRNMWVTHASSAEPTKVLWDRMAKATELDSKTDKTAAQLFKFVADGTGVSKQLITGFNFNTVLAPGHWYVQGTANAPDASTTTYWSLIVYSTDGYTYYEATKAGTSDVIYRRAYESGAAAWAAWRKLSTAAILGGTTVPGNALGADGDVYVQYI